MSDPFLTADGMPYYGIYPSVFLAVINHLKLEPEHFVFVDIGCGKGRALFLAAAYRFRRIIGIEVSPLFHTIAVDNIAKFRSVFPLAPQINAILGDAAMFSLPPEPVFLWFNNPFGEQGMTQMILALRAAYQRNKQEMEIAYFHPICEHLLDAELWLHKRDTMHVALTDDEVTRCVLRKIEFRVAFYTTIV